MVPSWSADFIPLMTIGQLSIPGTLKEKRDMVQKVMPFVMIAGRMYRKGADGILRLCVEPEEQYFYLKHAHETIGGIHMAGDQTLRRLMWAGVWWPTMKTEAYAFVLDCGKCGHIPPKASATLYQITIAPKWADYLVEYIQERKYPEDATRARKKAIQVESKDYEIIADQLYKRGKDHQLRLVVTEAESLTVVKQAHEGITGGHFSADTTAKAIMTAGLWWPTLFLDAAECVSSCDQCQRTKVPIRKDNMPLRPMMGARAFAKWGIDYVGPINPPAHKTRAQYIIVATDYLTKWVEAKATQKNDARTTACFLYEYVFTRYGLPIEIVSDRGTHFINEVIEYLLEEFLVIHKKSAPYHPQANGQAESTNKILCTVLTKIVEEKRTDWEMKLHSALWAYRVAYKTAIGTTPFNMVYGLDAILPIEFLIPTLRVARQLEWTGHELSERVEDIAKLDEFRMRAVAGMYAQKRRLKQFHDSHVINKQFQKGDLVLAYTLKQHTSKLKKRGMGPYLIHNLSNSGAVHLATLDGVPMANWISGCRLKKYKEPLTEEILKRLHATKERIKQENKMKAQAQREAKERAAKLRRQRLGLLNETRIQVIKASESTTQTLKPYILVEIGEQKETEIALIDTGADINALNHETWESLGKPTLNPCNLTINTISGSNITVEGMIKLPVFIGTTDVHAEFVVMKTGTLDTPVILGQPWQRTYNGATNWREEGINFEVDENKYFTPFFNEETSSQSDSTEVQNKVQEPKTQITKPASPPTNKHKRTVWKWVPKMKATNQPDPTQPTSVKPIQANQRVVQRWLPRSLLKAQGYYEGVAQVWIPKKIQPPRPQPQKTSCPVLTRSPKITQEWRIKHKQESNCHEKHKQNNTASNDKTEKWQWIPKRTGNANEESLVKSRKIQPSLIMQIKIRHLQALLFGINSLSLPYEWPTPLTLQLLYN